jgi:hypothetical protein
MGSMEREAAFRRFIFLLSSSGTRAQSISHERVEFFRLLFLRHHAAAVEDFQLGARVQA